ncbi:MAG: SBBP repeat-containing protein [Planctomycetota bacterium]
MCEPKQARVLSIVAARSCSLCLVGVLLLAAARIEASPQGWGDEAWSARFDGPGNAVDEATDIAVDSQGNTYITGYSESAELANYTTIALNAKDRSVRWVASYDGPVGWDDRAVAIAVDERRGRVYVTGKSHGGDSWYDYATCAHDLKHGTVLWAARYGGAGSVYDEPSAMALDASGNVYVTGTAGYHGATVSYDCAGEERWRQSFSAGIATDVTVDGRAGRVYVVGSRQVSGTNYDYTVRAYDCETGAEDWVASYTGEGEREDTARAVAVAPTGTIIVTGESDTPAGFDWATVAYDSDGQRLWVARYDGTAHDDDHARLVAVGSEGRVFVAGDSDNVGSDLDTTTVAYDERTGTLLWSRWYSSAGRYSDTASALAYDPATDRVFVAGSARSSTTWDDYVTIAYGAVDGTEAWTATYSGPEPASREQARALALAPEGAILVTGRGYDVERENEPDMLTVAFSTKGGAELWTQAFNGSGSGNDSAAALVVDPGGRSYLAGDVSRTFNSDKDDFLIVTYDADGNLLWEAVYGGPGNAFDALAAVAVDPQAGRLYVTGQSETKEGYLDYATLALDSRDGRLLWAAPYDRSGRNDRPADIAVAPMTGRVIVTGGSYDLATGWDFATVAYDSGGDEVWVARYHDSSYHAEGARALAVGPSGLVHVTGCGTESSGQTDWISVTYDPLGAQVWLCGYDGPAHGYDEPVAITVDEAGIVYVTGRSEGIGTDDDYVTLAYDPLDGSELWVARFNGPANGRDRPVAIAASSGQVFVTGETVLGDLKAYATVAYRARDGAELWTSFYNKNGRAWACARALAVDGARGVLYVTGDEDRSYYTSQDIATVAYAMADGAFLGVATYDGPARQTDIPCAVAVDAYGNVIVGGSSYGSHTYSDFLTIKYPAFPGDAVVRDRSRFETDLPTRRQSSRAGILPHLPQPLIDR